jgi:cobalt-precorrin-5B (C1)-methyltransferase
MIYEQPRSGYTLPVFACAAAVAALRLLLFKDPVRQVELDLVEPPQKAIIPVEQGARISNSSALAITYSDPGDNLDLTRHTPVWALVSFNDDLKAEDQIVIEGGEGIGKLVNFDEKAAIYSYARKVINFNLKKYLLNGEKIRVKIILPEGKKLADRTSNAAFGVVEGLALLGSTGISQPVSVASQLGVYQQELEEKASSYDRLVFCIGENGLDLAQKLGIEGQRLMKIANWIGPMLVAAAFSGVKEILLFGYHGKLIKLAGGIFHTHHHLADGRLEILTAHCANLGLDGDMVKQVFNCQTADKALELLREFDGENHTNWVEKIYGAIAAMIDGKAQDYVYNHSEKKVTIGSLLFDRKRKIIITSNNGKIFYPPSGN